METFLFDTRKLILCSLVVFHSTFSVTGTGKSLGMVGEVEDKVGG